MKPPTQQLEVSTECGVGSGLAPKQTQGPRGRADPTQPAFPTPAPLSPGPHSRPQQSPIHPECHSQQSPFSYTTPLTDPPNPTRGRRAKGTLAAPTSQMRTVRLKTEGMQQSAQYPRLGDSGSVHVLGLRGPEQGQWAQYKERRQWTPPGACMEPGLAGRRGLTDHLLCAHHHHCPWNSPHSTSPPSYLLTQFS